MANRMKKINLDFEQLPKIETEFSELTAIPFKVLEVCRLFLILFYFKKFAS
jgi:hypothetical protein